MANGIVLSILIPTIIGREEPFSKLCGELNRQLKEFGIWNEVEIVSECDNRVMSIGDKRQLLLTKSFGDFIVFIDDDDWISPDYCLNIWHAIKDYGDQVECIGFLQECTFDNGAPQKSCISIEFHDWACNVRGYSYVRTPFFPSPIRRDIALEIGYKDLRWAEDYDFSKRLKQSGLLKKEAFIDKVMYYYRYTHAPHEKKYGKPK